MEIEDARVKIMKIEEIKFNPIAGGMLYREGDAAVRTISSEPGQFMLASRCLWTLIDGNIDDYMFYKKEDQGSLTLVAWRKEPENKVQA